MMEIFEVQTKLTSYTYPLVKICVSVVVVLFGLFRDRFFHIPAGLLNFVVTLLCVAASLASILCCYISIGELFYVRKNRKKAKRK